MQVHEFSFIKKKIYIYTIIHHFNTLFALTFREMNQRCNVFGVVSSIATFNFSVNFLPLPHQ